MTTSSEVLANFEAALDALKHLDPNALCDDDSVVASHRHLAELDAITVGAVGAFDAGRHWEPDGARPASTCLAVRCRLPMAACRRRVRAARQLRAMPATEAAWRAGTLATDH